MHETDHLFDHPKVAAARAALTTAKATFVQLCTILLLAVAVPLTVLAWKAAF